MTDQTQWHPNDIIREDGWVVVRNYWEGAGGEHISLSIYHSHPPQVRTSQSIICRPYENLHVTISCSSDWEGLKSIVYRCRTCAAVAPDSINGFIKLWEWDR